MQSFTQEKTINCSAKQMFDLVMDIENYPKFLPWCKNAEIVEKISNNIIHADLYVNFKNIHESYRSEVTFDAEENDFNISVKAISGPFRRLINNWQFNHIDDKNCRINFHVEFEFNSKILTKLIGFVFKDATKKMIKAFEDRAKEIYNK